MLRVGRASKLELDPTIKIQQCIRMAVPGQQVNNKKKYSAVNMDLYERVMKDYYLLYSLNVRVDETQTAYLQTTDWNMNCDKMDYFKKKWKRKERWKQTRNHNEGSL
jgi:hypothetical protein